MVEFCWIPIILYLLLKCKETPYTSPMHSFKNKGKMLKILFFETKFQLCWFKNLRRKDIKKIQLNKKR